MKHPIRIRPLIAPLALAAMLMSLPAHAAQEPFGEKLTQLFDKLEAELNLKIDSLFKSEEPKKSESKKPEKTVAKPVGVAEPIAKAVQPPAPMIYREPPPV